ncbi:MAG: Hint domain-containing protein [Pseudomonadota bacterium]
MGTGYRGAFVISWSQTELDGVQAAPMNTLAVGVTWGWSGDAVRVDGPSDVLRLEEADEGAKRRRCAAKLVRRLVSAAKAGAINLRHVEDDQPGAPDGGFVVTDGLSTYSVTLVPVEGGAPPLLMFVDEMPPKGVPLWVVHLSLDAEVRDLLHADSGGVICFTPGTRIQTPEGPVAVEDLREGDAVQTKDSGPQRIEWTGSRRMSGARLFAMPHLRPIRICAGSLGMEQPDQDLLVSPQHRMLVRGAVARVLFNTPEVLVSAKDLVNQSTITTDVNLREVTYVHLLLPSHQIVWANGVETESFHPASASLASLDDEDRARLLALHPQLETEAHSYGSFARRNLNASEVAILKHEAA